MKEKDPSAFIKSLPSFFADEFHKLQDSLMDAEVSGKGGRVLMFTSSQSQEGVTSIVLGFGLFLARADGPDRVLAVEANVRNPSWLETLDLKQQDGLQAVMEEKVQAEAAILMLHDLGISVLPADRSTGSSDMLSSESYRRKLKNLFTELKLRYQFVLVEAPPTLPFVDARVISTFCDAVIVVLEANRTRAEQINDALNGLKAAGANVLGIILNKRDFHIPDYVYRFL